MHKKECGFFTDMYGNMSDLYLRINKDGVIIMIERDSTGILRPDKEEKQPETFWNKN